MLVTRARQAHYILLQAMADLLGIVVGLFAAYWLRLASGMIPTAGDWQPLWYWQELPQAVVIWILALHLTGNYQNHPQVISFNRARRILTGSALAIAVAVAKNYFFRVPDLSRLMYPIAFLCVAVGCISSRCVLQKAIAAFVATRSIPSSRVLIVGVGPTALKIAARIRRHPEYAYSLAGFLSPNESARGRRIGGVPVLGTPTQLREVLRDHSIQDVFIAQQDLSIESAWSMFLESEMETARVHVVPTLAEMMRTTIYYDELVGVPVYRVRETPLQGTNLIVKRAFDVVVAGFAIALAAPLFAILAILVKRASPGPVLYRQRRLSLDGSAFDLWKFRTMPVDSEAHGPVWGDQDDPRTNRVCNRMRVLGLDELPQLWNVLRGDMSLVGPRPERGHFVERFRENIPHYMARHHVLPGVTGWAQVHGLRGNTSIPQRLRFDLYYIENWSLWLDVKILLMTLVQPFRKRKPRVSHRHPHARTGVSGTENPIPQRGNP